jgi:peroxiredoxin
MRLLRLFVVASMLISAISPCAGEEAARAKVPEVDKRAPDFELPVVGSDGFLKLSDECKEGPTVVIVVRGFPGYQCPLCSSQMAALANRAKALGQAAHRVIVVYPGKADELQSHAETFMGSRKLPKPLVIVRDDDMEMVESWGLRWDAPHETAYPATFVFDTNGRVRWKKVSHSHGERSSVEEILRELRKL